MISGTDPTNPKCPADIVAELQRMEKTAEAMAYRARQLRMFAAGTRDVLLDQQVPLRRAQEASDLISVRMHALAAALDDAANAAQLAVGGIEASGAHPRQSFAWRPGVPGRR